MSKLYLIVVLFVLVMLALSCAAPPTVNIIRHPGPIDYRSLNIYTEPPTYDPNSTEQWQMDLRSSDLTKLDLSKSKQDLLYASFDSKTKWPESTKMPADFDWQQIMEINKVPGLGIRALHDHGITGKGVGIAIIDQTLLVDHIEYKDRLRLYEETGDVISEAPEAQMHGPAVASIAVGKSTGVAPDADLYFIATGFCGAVTFQEVDFACWAKSVRRIVEINQSLSEDRKIRVLSLSWGWNTKSTGYEEITAAVNEAKAAGIFVISSSLSKTDGFRFQGLGREPLSDPNDIQSYGPGLWWRYIFYEDGLAENTLLVPMDSRTTASPTGQEDYVFYREGGWSWSIPYIAGVYALAVQVNPSITPDEFWTTALQTGDTIQIQQFGKEYKFGVILNPQVLIEAIQGK